MQVKILSPVQEVLLRIKEKIMKLTIRSILNTISPILIILLWAAICICFIYGCYWLAKTVSYSIFYEDMVRQTVIEMVKSTSLL